MPARRGQMKERVTFQQNSPVTDAVGGDDDNWSAISNGTVWARVRPLTGRELVAGGELSSTFTHEITVNRRSDILAITTDKLRILWGSKTLDVMAIKTDERSYQMDIMAKEGVPT